MAGKKRALGGRNIRKTIKSLAHETSGGGFARGGKIDDAEKEDEEPRKRGGAAKKEGGPMGGEKSPERADRRARGGRTSAPFSSAGSTTDREGSRNAGHEGE